MNIIAEEPIPVVNGCGADSRLFVNRRGIRTHTFSLSTIDSRSDGRNTAYGSDCG